MKIPWSFLFFGDLRGKSRSAHSLKRITKPLLLLRRQNTERADRLTNSWEECRMGDTSSSTSQTIALPQGGGALHGIGEKFSPDLHTGTGNFTVPIALPPGRHGFQPQLNLVYSTGQGNGPFGLGWSLSLPGVTRKTS